MIEVRSRALAERGVVHGFAGRRGGVSTGAFATANASGNVGDDPAAVAENRRRFALALGTDPMLLCTLRQVHGTVVHGVTTPPPADLVGDALISRTPGLLLAVTTADCVPVLLADPRTGWAAAIHAGWRGTVGGIVGRSVAAWFELGVRPADCIGAIGPCIRAASYEVDAPVRDAALAMHPNATALFRPKATPGRWTFDLAGLVALALDESGVKLVDDVGVDTLEQQNIYFSYRRARLRGEAAYGVQLSGVVVPG